MSQRQILFHDAPRFDHHLPVTFRGGMKVDESAHHCYLFMLRKGLWVNGVLECEVSVKCVTLSGVLVMLKIISPDCPRNLVIKCDNQTGTHLEPHELDVIVTVKTNAADDFLCQAMCSKSNRKWLTVNCMLL